jgi:PAS domain-containing protein
LKGEEPQWLQQMGSILETLNDGVVIADDSNQILFANAVFEEMTGTPRSEIIGTDARQLYDRAEEFALAQAFHQKALEIGRSREEFFLDPQPGGDRSPEPGFFLPGYGREPSGPNPEAKHKDYMLGGLFAGSHRS